MFNFKKNNALLKLLTITEIQIFKFNENRFSHFRSYSSIEVKTPKGIFIIYIANKSELTTAIFLFLDLKSNRILNHELYKGPNFYTKFTKFIWKTILELEKDNNPNYLFLIPKFYINKSLESRIEDLSKFKIESYTIKTDNYHPIVGEIKKLLKINFSIHQTSIRKLINKINNHFNPKPWFTSKIIQKPIISINKLSKRMYSTFSKDLNMKNIKEHNQASRWREFAVNIKLTLDDITIRNLLDEFWVLIAEERFNANKDWVLAIQLRVELEEGLTRSITTIDLVKNKDLNKIKDIYCEIWSYKAYNYKHFNVKKAYLWYNFFPEGEYKSKINSIHLLHREPESYSPKTLHTLIPKNMDYKSWGPYEYISYRNMLKIQLTNSNLIAHVTQENNHNLVYVYVKDIGGLVLIDSFVDTELATSKDLYTFKRQSDKRILYYNQGSQVLLIETPTKWNFIPQLKIIQNKKGEIIKPRNKVITMDLETRQMNNIMRISCISVCYVDKSIKTFGEWGCIDREFMIIEAFNSIFNKDNDKASVYFHNFSGFDGVFIYNILVGLSNIKVSPIYRDGRIITMKISYNDPSTTMSNVAVTKFMYSVTIYDSFLLLPASLDKLAKAFKIEQRKGFFPLKFLDNKVIDWNYEGEVPELKYFYTPHPLHKRQYEDYVLKYEAFCRGFEDDGVIRKWILKDELIKYCENDVIVLHGVILAFTEHIFDKYKINIQKLPTLPSVAFAIYRSKFLRDSNLVPIITGTIYSDIKHAYYGGFVDIYRPFARNVKSYDVNSLYPSAMSKYPMPVGIPQYFDGSPKYIDDLFGFVFVKVIAPLNLKTPILPVKIKRSGASTTIYPTGTWSGWYFTEEINNAKKYGYKFEILKGYTFKKSNIFKDYVSELYSIKCSVSSDNPWYMISKILLNSLYGRFGMSPYLDTYKLINEDEFLELLKKDSIIIKDFDEFGDKFGVSFRDLKLDKLSMHNVSVPIAAAISAWSRVEMCDYVVKNSDNICCIDTDGIKVTCDLPAHQVGSDLGLMKLEDEFQEATFIAPKVYGGITKEHKMVIKVKGLKEPLSYWQLKTLLYGDPLIINQSKWFRDFVGGTIQILNQIYTLACNENKRQIIENSFGQFIGTLPYQMSDGMLLKMNKSILFYLKAPLLEGMLLTSPLFEGKLLAPPKVLESYVIYLPAPLPEVIYLPAPLPEVIYLPPFLPDVIYLPAPENKKTKIWVFDNLLGTSALYPSVKSICASIEVSERTVRRYLKSDGQNFVKTRYRFYYDR